MQVRRLTRALACSITLLLPSCLPRQTDEVALYRGILDQAVPALPEPVAGEDLTLPHAISLANQHYEELALRGEDYVQAMIAQHRLVMSFLPTITLQPSFTIEDPPSGTASSSAAQGITGPSIVTGGAGGTTGSQSGFRRSGSTLQRTEVPVVGGLTFFRGFSDLRSLQAAEATVEQRRQLLLDLQATVLLNVAQSYYQVLRTERLVGLLEDSLRLREDRLQDVQNRFSNGLATKLEVAQSEAQRDATLVSLTQARSDVRNSRSVLAALLGRTDLEQKLSDAFRAPDTIDTRAEYEKRLREVRPDIRAAQAALEAAQQNVKAALGEYYPSVSINVAGFLYREFYSDASTWNAVLSANLPIFSAGRIEADVRTAWSLLRQAALSRSLVERNAVRDLHIAYENFETSTKKLAQLRSQVAASDEAYCQALSAYKNGLAINLDVSQALEDLLSAQLQLVSAGFDHIVFYLDLLRSSGDFPSQPLTQPSI